MKKVSQSPAKLVANGGRLKGGQRNATASSRLHREQQMIHQATHSQTFLHPFFFFFQFAESPCSAHRALQIFFFTGFAHSTQSQTYRAIDHFTGASKQVGNGERKCWAHANGAGRGRHQAVLCQPWRRRWGSGRGRSEVFEVILDKQGGAHVFTPGACLSAAG